MTLTKIGTLTGVLAACAGLAAFAQPALFKNSSRRSCYLVAGSLPADLDALVTQAGAASGESEIWREHMPQRVLPGATVRLRDEGQFAAYRFRFSVRLEEAGETVYKVVCAPTEAEVGWTVTADTARMTRMEGTHTLVHVGESEPVEAPVQAPVEATPQVILVGVAADGRFLWEVPGAAPAATPGTEMTPPATPSWPAAH
jgi:hypothetical protein